MAGAALAVRSLAGRITQLEEMLAKRRHTYPTANGLEDSLGVALNIMQEEQVQAKWREARINELWRILGEIREGPLAYDSDRPADRRPRPNGSKGR